MIPIKIQCGCGQPYAFEVEPILGQMPSAVACPACGADGTPAANAYLAQTVPAPTMAAVAPVRSAPMRVAVSTPAVAPSSPGPTLASRSAATHVAELDPAQIEHEARAKILWGDAPGDVITHLIIKGVNPDEAAGLVQTLLKERAAGIRVNGIKKIFVGAGLVCVPIATVIAFIQIGATSFTILGIAGAIGLWGGWMVLKGIFMVLAPKSEAGDISEQ